VCLCRLDWSDLTLDVTLDDDDGQVEDISDHPSTPLVASGCEV